MDKELIQPFISSVQSILKKMVNLDVLPKGESYPEGNEIKSQGVTSIISYFGKVGGRFIIDMEPKTAIKITERVTGRNYSTAKDEMVLSTISEINNIVAGGGVTDINNKLALSLRLVPPVVFAGDETMVCLDKIYSESVDCETDLGKIRINVAFERSLE